VQRHDRRAGQVPEDAPRIAVPADAPRLERGLRRPELGEVGAGGEVGPVGPQQQGTDARYVPDRAQRLDQAVTHGEVVDVELVRPVERHDGDAVVA
jgi:hypothetical protein